MELDQVLAFRVARQRLDARGSLTFAEAAACPASDFQRGSALLALAARSETVDRESYDRAADTGELVIAPSLRAAIHALPPADFAVYGRALVAEDDEELEVQLGPRTRWQTGDGDISPRAAVEEVTDAIGRSLGEGRALGKDELHEAMRGFVRVELLPWCRGCESHHVAPMLWRYGGVMAGMRCDSNRRFLLGCPGVSPDAAAPVLRFLAFHGPATPKDFGAWAGLAGTHAHRLWALVSEELVEVRLDGRRTWLPAADEAALASPPQARGVRLLPPRDPYLQHPDRGALAPDPALRKRLFRPVGGPGAVLQDGVLSGLWRVRARGRRAELDVEALRPIRRDDLEAEAARIAELRGADALVVRWS